MRDAIAVHSLKDLPTDKLLDSYWPRYRMRKCGRCPGHPTGIVSPSAQPVCGSAPAACVVRWMQLKHLRPDLEVAGIRQHRQRPPPTGRRPRPCCAAARCCRPPALRLATADHRTTRTTPNVAGGGSGALGMQCREEDPAVLNWSAGSATMSRIRPLQPKLPVPHGGCSVGGWDVLRRATLSWRASSRIWPALRC